MKARDVMVSPVVTVKPYSSVKEVAKILIEKSISAVPVTDDSGKLVGIVSEGDLVHRSEAGTERQRSWWLRLMAGDDMLAADYVKAHGRKIADVMTRNVVTATPAILGTMQHNHLASDCVPHFSQQWHHSAQ
jgi:CBS domain-containing protein